MAGEIVYADLNILGASSNPLHPPRHLNHTQCLRWHRLAAGLGAAGILILLGAVIAMGVWVFQTKGSLSSLENKGTRETLIHHQSNCSTGLKDFHFHLKQFVCENKSSGNSTEGSGCKLCPPNWLLHRDKCYWVSKDKTLWDKSRDDCSRRSSRLLVIRDQDEMTFIQTTSKGANQLWLGLTVTSPARKWIWVDGSLFNPTLFNVTDPAKGNSCGMIKADKISFETCDAASKWICEKEALQI
ncbi:killer cell lectin-like receptor subfamily B member 1B allele C [Mauremys mutica]|uniref:killer cell lectin-like receptor subfamily B member 1B allele C n=1 Tax=Mauremys mutica TaxID=74926 RepID=UPI001D16E42C|nr:killer cell lectin-like receptor subfamily B member 1B allele C [Mauremys mutica]